MAEKSDWQKIAKEAMALAKAADARMALRDLKAARLIADHRADVDQLKGALCALHDEVQRLASQVAELRDGAPRRPQRRKRGSK